MRYIILSSLGQVYDNVSRFSYLESQIDDNLFKSGTEIYNFLIY